MKCGRGTVAPLEMKLIVDPSKRFDSYAQGSCRPKWHTAADWLSATRMVMLAFSGGGGGSLVNP